MLAEWLHEGLLLGVLAIWRIQGVCVFLLDTILEHIDNRLVFTLGETSASLQSIRDIG